MLWVEADGCTLQEKIDAVDGWTLDNQLGDRHGSAALPAIRQRALKPLRRGEIAAFAPPGLLIQKPSILLLDEPTNHLDA